MMQWSRFKTEMEVLFRPGAIFKVMDRFKVGETDIKTGKIRVNPKLVENRIYPKELPKNCANPRRKCPRLEEIKDIEVVLLSEVTVKARVGRATGAGTMLREMLRENDGERVVSPSHNTIQE